MKKLLFLFAALISYTLGSAQNYSDFPLYGGNYGRLATNFTFHVPAGNTATLNSTKMRAGAIYMDTTGADSGFYYYSGGTWQRLARAGESGGVIDTLLLSTRAWRQKGIDSLVAAFLSGSSSSLDSLLPAYTQIPQHGLYLSSTDTVYVYTDSYGSATGATANEKGWVQQLARQLGGVWQIFSVSGSTIQKRTPLDYNGTANMVDRLSTISIGSLRGKFLIIAMGLNDVGQTAAAYNTTNYQIDYDSVMHYITGTRGWDPKKILIIAPYYIGQAGYNAYAGITGNPRQTPAGHRAYVYATKQVAKRWGTMFLDIYSDQLRNDTTLLNADNIHANNGGYDYVFKDVWSYIGTGVNANLLKATGTGNGILYEFRDRPYTGQSANPPMQLRMDATYSSVAGSPANIKWQLYFDGSTNNTTGFSVDNTGMYANSFDRYHFYSLGARFLTLGSGGNEFLSAIEIGRLGTGSLDMLELDHRSSYGGAGNGTYITFSSVATILGRFGSFYDGTGFGLEGYVHSGSVLQIALTIKGNRTAGFGGQASPTAWIHSAAGTTTIAPEKKTSGSLLTTIEVGAEEYNNAHYQSNNALNRYGLGGVISDNATSVSNSTTTVTTLSTYTTKASTLAATGEAITFEYSGKLDDVGQNVTVVISFGGTTIGTFNSTASPSGWVIKGKIVRTGSTTVTAEATFLTNTTIQPVTIKLTGLTLSGTNVLLLTGQSASGNTDAIVKELARVKWEPVSAN